MLCNAVCFLDLNFQIILFNILCISEYKSTPIVSVRLFLHSLLKNAEIKFAVYI